MTASRTVIAKISDWSAAYNVIKDELSPQAFRELMALANTDNPISIQTGMAAARIVFANDRAAATVAALLTQSGIKPVALDLGEE